MSLSSLRLATLMMIVFIVAAYIYPEGILVTFYIADVISLYLLVLILYLGEETPGNIRLGIVNDEVED